MEIATRIHQEAGISMVEASRLLEWILELIKTTLHSGESIMIAGFGKLPSDTSRLAVDDILIRVKRSQSRLAEW